MSLFLADVPKSACKSCSRSDAQCKSLWPKGNYFPGPGVINLNSLVSQIVTQKKYGAARDSYLLWHPIAATLLFFFCFSLPSFSLNSCLGGVLERDSSTGSRQRWPGLTALEKKEGAGMTGEGSPPHTEPASHLLFARAGLHLFIVSRGLAWWHAHTRAVKLPSSSCQSQIWLPM